MASRRRSRIGGPRRLRRRLGTTARTAAYPVTAPEIRLGRQEPNSLSPAIYAIIERGCLKRPELVEGLRSKVELRLTDGYPRVRLTFAEAGIFVEDTPADEPSADPPGEAASLEELAARTATADEMTGAGVDPMLDTGVRMALFEPDVVVEGSITEIIAIMAAPMFRGVPNLTDPRGWAALASLAAGRVRFKGNLLHARQLVRLLEI